MAACMYVCTYGTAERAANILCKEMLYDLMLPFMYYLGGNEFEKKNIFSLHSLWRVKRKKEFFSTELALNAFCPKNNNASQSWPTVQLAVPLQ